MIPAAPTLDDQLTVSQISPAIIGQIAARIEASHSPEQIIYRETELDEVWRLADLTLASLRTAGAAGSAEVQTWTQVAELVHAAHDLIGDHEDTIAAAAALRKAALLLA